jgi:hypothetical protein
MQYSHSQGIHKWVYDEQALLFDPQELQIPATFGKLALRGLDCNCLPAYAMLSHIHTRKTVER